MRDWTNTRCTASFLAHNTSGVCIMFFIIPELKPSLRDLIAYHSSMHLCSTWGKIDQSVLDRPRPKTWRLKNIRLCKNGHLITFLRFPVATLSCLLLCMQNHLTDNVNFCCAEEMHSPSLKCLMERLGVSSTRKRNPKSELKGAWLISVFQTPIESRLLQVGIHSTGEECVYSLPSDCVCVYTREIDVQGRYRWYQVITGTERGSWTFPCFLVVSPGLLEGPFVKRYYCGTMSCKLGDFSVNEITFYLFCILDESLRSGKRSSH